MKTIKLISLAVSTNFNADKNGGGIPPLAAMVIRVCRRSGEKEFREDSFGEGSVDAVCRAINKVAKITPEVLVYNCKSVTKTTESDADTVFIVRYRGATGVGAAQHGDVITSAALAYAAALTNLFVSVSECRGWPKKQ